MRLGGSGFLVKVCPGGGDQFVSLQERRERFKQLIERKDIDRETKRGNVRGGGGRERKRRE